VPEESKRLDAPLLTAPNTPGMMESEREIRYELPLLRRLESLAYIGMVRHETWHVSSHSHDHFELCYIEEGQGWFTIGDVYYTVNPGDLFITKPGELHQGAARGDLPFRLYYLGFQLDQLRSLVPDFYSIGLNRVRQDENRLVKQICDLVFQELREQKDHADLMVQGLFIQLLASVARTYHDRRHEVEEKPVRIDGTILQLLNHLHAHVRGDYHIDELLQTFPVSRSHLAREFKRHMGLSIGQYIRSLLIDMAKHYLRETDRSISEIAELLHFSSIHTFSIFFKRHAGVSPLAYRNRT
jgi:AraC-like DNA-binding protein/mannose-6-phosphate isomerase-like protein (cupin superfamily)